MVESLARSGISLLARRRRALRAWLPLGLVRGISILRIRGRRREAVQLGDLGIFKLARDEDDAAVGENGADPRDEDGDERDDVRNAVF